MKNLLLLLCVFASVSPLLGQRLWLLPQLSDADSSFYQSSIVLSINADAGFRSNSIENEMVDKLLFGGYIGNDVIQRAYDRMAPLGRMGAQSDANFTFQMMSDSLFGNAKWGWQGKVQSRIHLESSFNKGLFSAVFQGNGGEGEVTQNVDAYLDFMQYQKFGVGVFHKPSMSGFTFSAVNGQQFERFRNTESSLFTSSESDSLALEHNIYYGRSDTITSGFLSGDGIGVSFDGVLNVPLKGSKGLISLEVFDLGFVAWNESTLINRSKDTWSYTGFDLNEILDENQDTVLPSYPDSLDANAEVGKEIRLLPGRLEMRLLHQINLNDFFEIGMSFRPVDSYEPYFRAAYFYHFTSRTLVGAQVATGGYGTVRFGISAEKWFGKNWYVAVGTEDVYGLISKQGLGMQGTLRLSYLIQRNAS
ncbi:MAG: hypothetical protein ACI923_002020 [Flavobacteriales bacterium]|jgi:hypothetical protein